MGSKAPQPESWLRKKRNNRHLSKNVPVWKKSKGPQRAKLIQCILRLEGSKKIPPNSVSEVLVSVDCHQYPILGVRCILKSGIVMPSEGAHYLYNPYNGEFRYTGMP